MNQRKIKMSPKTNPDYFGKSPFDHLKNVAAAAHKIMHPETEKEEVAKEDSPTVEPTTTEQEKTNG